MILHHTDANTKSTTYKVIEAWFTTGICTDLSHHQTLKKMQEVLFKNIQARILSEIKQSTTNISIAVAWFNNQHLFNSLRERAQAGVQVKLIIINDRINNRAGGLDFQKLIDAGANFYFAKTHRLMHHKFCVIDSSVVFNGSYNWTYAAESRNHENLLLSVGDASLVINFNSEFDALLGVADRVRNVQQYLAANPPQKNVLDTEQALREEDLAEIAQIAVNRPTLRAPSRSDIKRKHYDTFSENLGQFCRRYPQVLLFQIGKNYDFSHRILEKYTDKVHWGHVQWNENTLWDYSLIKRFRSTLFELYATGIWVPTFFKNSCIKVSINQINELGSFLKYRYSELKNSYPAYDESQLSLDEPFFINEIPSKYANPEQIPDGQIDDNTVFWKKESYVNVQWTDELIRRYQDKIIFGYLNSAGSSFPVSLPLLAYIKNHSPLKYRLLCCSIPFTNSELNGLKDMLDWDGIALNAEIHWSEELFQDHQERLFPHLKTFSGNKKFPWTPGFIEKYREQLCFKNLSVNEMLPWTEELMFRYADSWNYSGQENICTNRAACWSELVLDHLKGRLDWDRLSRNESVGWSMHLIEKYAPLRESDQYFVGFAYNQSVWKNVFSFHVNDTFLMNIADDLDHTISINDY